MIILPIEFKYAGIWLVLIEYLETVPLDKPNESDSFSMLKWVNRPIWIFGFTRVTTGNMIGDTIQVLLKSIE